MRGYFRFLRLFNLAQCVWFAFEVGGAVQLRGWQAHDWLLAVTLGCSVFVIWFADNPSCSQSRSLVSRRP